jgi:hypothetical protein
MIANFLEVDKIRKYYLFLHMLSFVRIILFALFSLILNESITIEKKECCPQPQGVISLTEELRTLVKNEKSEVEHPTDQNSRICSGNSQIRFINLRKYQVLPAGNANTESRAQLKFIKQEARIKDPIIPNLTPAVLIFPFNYFW